MRYVGHPDLLFVFVQRALKVGILVDSLLFESFHFGAQPLNSARIVRVRRQLDPKRGNKVGLLLQARGETLAFAPHLRQMP